MQAKRHPTAAEFLAAAEPLLLRREAENNIMLGFAHAMASTGIAPSDVFFATVADSSGVRAAAFSSLVARMVVTRPDVPEAYPALADLVATTRPTIREVLASEPAAGDFARELATRFGLEARIGLRQGIYQLDRVDLPNAPPPGAMRPAEPADLAVVTDWVAGFNAAIGEPGDAPKIAAERVGARQVFVWDDGGPRAMAAWAGKTPNGVRVNLVYTPPELRGQGYASILVARLSAALLERGNRFCFLYTDLDNPTSNRIYQQIGYRLVTNAAFYRLIPAAR